MVEYFYVCKKMSNKMKYLDIDRIIEVDTLEQLFINFFAVIHLRIVL